MQRHVGRVIPRGCQARRQVVQSGKADTYAGISRVCVCLYVVVVGLSFWSGHVDRAGRGMAACALDEDYIELLLRERERGDIYGRFET